VAIPGESESRFGRLPMLFIALATAGVVLLIALGGLALMRNIRGSQGATSTEVGGLAPDITVTDESGKQVRLSDYRGKSVLLNFRTTWCGYCRQEAPELQAAYEAEPELVIMPVNVREDAPTVAGYAKELGLTLPMFLDESGDAATAYDVRGIPASFFIGPDGRVFAKAVGPLTASRIRDYLAERE